MHVPDSVSVHAHICVQICKHTRIHTQEDDSDSDEPGQKRRTYSAREQRSNNAAAAAAAGSERVGGGTGAGLVGFSSGGSGSFLHPALASKRAHALGYAVLQQQLQLQQGLAPHAAAATAAAAKVGGCAQVGTCESAYARIQMRVRR
eukprot:1088731-Pelagomonas_calceolata.AAC.5